MDQAKPNLEHLPAQAHGDCRHALMLLRGRIRGHFCTLAGSLQTPTSVSMLRPEDILAPPDAQHWLGRDDAGKDVLSLLIYGARVSLIVGFTASFLSMFIGTTVGLICRLLWRAGRQQFLMRFVDFLMVIPDLPLDAGHHLRMGRGLWKIILVISLLCWTYTARLVRSQVLSVKERQFVLRARALGASNFRIIMRHIFPQVLPLIIAQAVLDISASIIAESSLAFSGFGRPHPDQLGHDAELRLRTRHQPQGLVVPAAAGICHRLGQPVDYSDRQYAGRDRQSAPAHPSPVQSAQYDLSGGWADRFWSRPRRYRRRSRWRYWKYAICLSTT